MTKNHILIKGIALGVLLMLSPTAQAAGGVDQVLVTYFNVLHKGASPKCSIDEMTKTRILAEIEPKCLIRTVKDEGSYISGVKSTCTDASVKAAVDSQVAMLCDNAAYKADQAKAIKAQEQAAAQQAAAAKQAQGGSGGDSGNSTVQNLKTIAQGLQTYGEIDKARQAAKAKNNPSTNNPSAGGGPSSMGRPVDAAIERAAAAQPVVDAAAAARVPEVIVSKYQTPDGGYVLARATGTAEEVTVTKFDAKGNAQPSVEFKDTPSATKVDAQIASYGADPQKPSFPVDAETAKAAREVAAPVQSAAQQATNGSGATGTDTALDTRNKAAAAEDKALETEIQTMKTQLDAAKQQAPNEATAKCNANEATRDPITMQTKNPKLEAECNMGAPQKAIICLETNVQALIAAQKELAEQKLSCSSNSAQAEKLCSMVRSEKAQQVQLVMSIGATVLSKITAASEACGTTSNLSKIAQGGMLAAQGACTAMKFRCDISCNAAEKTIKLMKTKAEAIKKCELTLEAIAAAGSQAQSAAQQLSTKLDQELTPTKSVPSSITQCENHKADIAGMGVAALGFLSAFQDAESCKKQLAAGGTNNSGKSTSSLAGPTMTTAEYCSMPANATSLTCKCTSNPSADGCIGSMAKSGVNIGKIGNGGGASAFASAKQSGLGAVDSLGKAANGSDEPAPGANLSEAAREALGIAVAPEGSGGSAGGAAGSAATDAAKKSKQDEEKEKPKFGFFSSLGNMISGGRKPDQAANATIRKHEQDQAIKRKLASDQVRAEISTASGKSNFDKIRSRYQQNAASFEQ